jgi:hypothetical protein
MSQVPQVVPDPIDAVAKAAEIARIVIVDVMARSVAAGGHPVTTERA